MVDRRLGIPGEDLPGSFSATDFVDWYCGHPDADARTASPCRPRRSVVIGVGNVAVDVARVLAKTADELSRTDVPGHVLDVLAASAVTRRPHDRPARARRTPSSPSRSCASSASWPTRTSASTRPDLELPRRTTPTSRPTGTLRGNLEVLRGWAGPDAEGRPRRLRRAVLAAPGGDPRRRPGERAPARADPAGRAAGWSAPASSTTSRPSMVLRSVGYRSVPLPGLPFDEDDRTVPHDGRPGASRRADPGEYVAGWLKRGPTGVIGTNKSDAAETVRTLLADADRLPRAPERDPDAIVELLRERKVRAVDWAGWEAIDAAEKALGAARDCARIKIADRETLLRRRWATSSASPFPLNGRTAGPTYGEVVREGELAVGGRRARSRRAVSLPTAVGALPARSSDLSATDLLARVKASGSVGHSGYAEAVGGLDLPLTADFTALTSLLGDRTRLRSWWRSDEDWRVDAVQTTGEAGTYRDASGIWSWDYEQDTSSAPASPTVRLPRVSDVEPAALGPPAAVRGRGRGRVRLPAGGSPAGTRPGSGCGRPTTAPRSTGSTSGSTRPPGSRCGSRSTGRTPRGRCWRRPSSTSPRRTPPPSDTWFTPPSRAGSAARPTPTWPPRSTSSPRWCRRDAGRAARPAGDHRPRLGRHVRVRADRCWSRCRCRGGSPGRCATSWPRRRGRPRLPRAYGSRSGRCRCC